MSRSTRSRWRVAAVVVALAVVAGACGSKDDNKNNNAGAGGGGNKKTIAFAFAGPETGPNAALGLNIVKGAQVALQEANASSDKYHFVLKPFDTQGDSAQITTVKDKFINDASVLGLIGPTFSGETKAVIQDLQTANLAMISASATNAALPTVIPNETVFHRLIPDDDVQGAGVTDFVLKVLKAKTAAYVNDNSDYGKGLADGTQALLEKAGVHTVATDVIDPKAEAYSAAVTKVKDAHPDIIFYGGYYAEAGKFKKQLTDEGVTAKFVSGDGSLDLGFVRSAGASGAEGAWLTCPCRLATPDAGGKLGKFATDYKKVNKGADAGTYSTQGYDAAKIFVQGVLAGNTTRQQLLTYVEGLKTYDGVAGTIELQDNGNVTNKDVYVYKVESGKLTEVGTVANAIAKG
ncbi:MAG: branched-chain amino acid transport system substrate-binding protein [Actinomycetota bacterium]|jgi:branched-chain amino acid transport system substrate-binding protein